MCQHDVVLQFNLLLVSNEDLSGDTAVKDVTLGDTPFASSAYQRWGDSTFYPDRGEDIDHLELSLGVVLPLSKIEKLSSLSMLGAECLCSACNAM